MDGEHGDAVPEWSIDVSDVRVRILLSDIHHLNTPIGGMRLLWSEGLHVWAQLNKRGSCMNVGLEHAVANRRGEVN